MHQTSYDLMKEFASKYVKGPCFVLDVGATLSSQNYGSIFTDCDYRTLSWDKGAHYQVEGYTWTNVPKDTFDVVISGQAFEHDKFFWLTLANIREVCKPDALVMIIVPSRGVVHRFPLDCYRFYEDARIPFSELLGADIVETVWNEEIGWGDLGMVFRVKK